MKLHKLAEMRPGGKEHAELLAKIKAASKPTLGDLLRKAKKSTMPQSVVDELESVMKTANIPLKKHVTKHDLEQLSALSGADVHELESLLGDEIKEAVEVLQGTNCANCGWADAKRRPAKKEELDEQNGILLDKKDYSKAKAADLVTLPGKRPSVAVFACNHPKLKLEVTTHNCCAYWDNPGCLRAWQKGE